MSNLSWCEFNKKRNLPIVHDRCPIPKCICQEQTNFTPNQFSLEGVGYKTTMRKIFQGNEKAWNSFLESAVNTLAPVNGMTDGAKSKNCQVGQARTNILKSISGVEMLSLTDMHGNGVRLKVMYFISTNLPG